MPSPASSRRLGTTGMKLGHVGLHTKLMLALASLVAVVAGGSAHFVVEHERDRRLHDCPRCHDP